MKNVKIFSVFLLFTLALSLSNVAFAEEDITWGVQKGDEFEWVVKTLIIPEIPEEADDEMGDFDPEEDIPFKQGDTIKLVIDEDLPTNYTEMYDSEIGDYVSLYINDEEEDLTDMDFPLVMPLTMKEGDEVIDMFEEMENEMKEMKAEIEEMLETLDAMIEADEIDMEYTWKFDITSTDKVLSLDAGFTMEMNDGDDYVKAEMEMFISFDKETGVLKEVKMYLDYDIDIAEDVDMGVPELKEKDTFHVEIVEKGGFLGLPISFSAAYALLAVSILGLSALVVRRK